MKLKEAMARAKGTGKTQKVDEGEAVESVKVGIYIRVDADTLTKLRAQAAKARPPYQTYINSKLNELADGDSILDRFEAVESRLEDFQRRINELSSSRNVGRNTGRVHVPAGKVKVSGRKTSAKRTG